MAVTSHLGQQFGVGLSDSSGVAFFRVGKYVCSAMYPGIGSTNVRPEGGSTGQSTLQQPLQAWKLYYEPPFWPSRSMDEWIA